MVTIEQEALKAKLADKLDGLTDLLPTTKRNDNLGPILGDIYIAQEAKKWADERLKKAWATAQDEDGPVPSDNDMRTFGKGEHIVCESTHFSVTARVDAPRATFDKDAFMEQVSKKFKVPMGALKIIAEGCLSKSAPPLTKRVTTAPGV